MYLSSKIKEKLVKSPSFLFLSATLTRSIPRIFLCHRFCDGTDENSQRIDGETFEWQLSQIKEGWNAMSLKEYITAKKEGKNLPKKLVVITVDDGYRDFYDVAYPRLKKFGLPATLFPTVNFIDGKIWLWPDRIHFALKKSERKCLSFEYLGKNFYLDSSNPEGHQIAWQQLSDFCVDARDADKWFLISMLEKELKVELPDSPPPDYAALTWHQLKEMSQNGIEIGSHTLNHPILSQIPEGEVIQEVVYSKRELERKLGICVETFCYPNGRLVDLNEAVVRAVEKADYRGSVVGDVFSSRNKYKSFDRFRIPRMGISRDKVDFLWKLCGMEFLVHIATRVLSKKLKIV